MCHSMGTRFFLRAFSTIKDMFLTRDPSNNVVTMESGLIQDSGDLGINLVNMIFLNPDYELETFKNDYQELKNVKGAIFSFFHTH